MASKKKLLTSAVALGTAAALTLGGTFAWQSINQTALNEASDIVNPGGRLHNDQNWVTPMTNDTNIYVENFTDPDANGDTIFARVRLSEYMEIVMNYGVEGAEVVETVAGKKFDTDGNEVTDKATDKDTYTYEYDIHYFDRDAEDSEEKNATGDFFKWTTGEEDSERPYFIPTYNMNKDSLLADLNGTYVDSVGGISNRGEEQYEYDAIDEESSKSGYEVYDGDVNTADEVGRADLLDLIENGTDAENYDTYKDNVVLTDEEVEHTAKQVGETRGLISMENWLALTEDTDRYWVYDEDGWVYWSSPIAAGETTGLLLDGFTLNQVMDDTWYYAINVESQFVTADDVGKKDGTGFYDAVNGTAPSENAEKLLEIIGVGQEEDNGPVLKMHSSSDYNSTGYIRATAGEAFRLQTSSGSTPSGDDEYMSVFTHGGSNYLERDTDYTYEDGYLTILVDSASKDYLNSYGSYLLVMTDGCTGAILLEDDGALTVDYDSDTPDCTLAAVGQGVTIRNAEDEAPAAYGVSLRLDAMSYDEGTEHYDYADGVLTITNADWVGKRVQVKTSDGSGWLIVTAGSTSGGNESTGGGQTDTDEDGTRVVDLTGAISATDFMYSDDATVTPTMVSVAFEEPIRLTTDGEADETMQWSEGIGVLSTNRLGSADSFKELEEEEYTFEDGVLTIHESERLKNQHFLILMSVVTGDLEGEDYDNCYVYYAILEIGCDTTLTLTEKTTEEDSYNITSAAYASLNEGITLTMPDGSHPGNTEGEDKVALYELSNLNSESKMPDESWSYDADTGVLTISDDEESDWIVVVVGGRAGQLDYASGDYTGLVVIKEN